jgi:hypothetical protein
MKSNFITWDFGILFYYCLIVKKKIREKVQKKSLNEILFLMDFISKKSGYIVRNTWVIVILDIGNLKMSRTQWDQSLIPLGTTTIPEAVTVNRFASSSSS